MQALQASFLSPTNIHNRAMPSVYKMHALNPNTIEAAPCFAAVCVQLHTSPTYLNARQLKWRPQIPVSTTAYHCAASLGWVWLRRPNARCRRC